MKTLALVLLLALGGVAHAEPADALDPATRAFFERAVAEEERGRHAQAAALYRLVLSKDPTFVPAALGLGRELEAAGQPAEAEQVYRSLGAEADAVEALARLIEPREPEEALALWRQLETLRLGDPLPYREQARLLARTDPALALSAWRTHETLLQGAEPDGPTVAALGAALLQAGMAAEGEALWRGYVEAFPDGLVAEELRARLDRLDVERRAGELALAGAEPLPDSLRAAFAEGLSALAEGRAGDAAAVGRRLVAAAPRSVEARGLLADALLAEGAWSDAEIHAVVARALAPDDAAARVRLGVLLAEGYGGRRHREAAEELREAALLRPGDPAIRYRLGVVEQHLGNWDAAAQALAAYVDAAPAGPEAEDAARRLAALRRQAPAAPDLPPPAPTHLPPEAELHYRIALELLRRGRAEEATRELDAALLAAPDAPVLLNQRARLARQAGDAEAARGWLERSLEADPDQGAVLVQLGDVARGRGDLDGARRFYERAAARGAPEAHLELAELAEARGDWATVRAALDAWEAAGGEAAPLHGERAAALRARAERRLRTVQGAAAALLAVTVGAPLAWWAHRRTADTLRDLLDGHPECWHEAARLLSGLRHEVLKHNTTVLPDVADALDRGERGPWDALATRASELRERFDAYLGALVALGRRHGRRLDLHHRDPILGPVSAAMRRLVRLAEARRGRLPDPAELRALSAAINGEGYARIGQIVREICVLPVTDALVREVYDRVVREPGFAGGPVPALGVESDDGLAVRMFRNDLEDILANVLRNALAAGAGRLEVALGREDDPITGHEWVEVQVRDDAPGQLTNAMIRGRYIGRGLGLAVDIINKHGGSIRVDGAPDGMKAVCVQLPGVEAAEVEVEWS